MKLCIVAQKAGSEIMGVRESFKPEEFELKGDGSPVTVADLRAHRIIEEALSKIHPEIPIVSEEGSAGDPLSSELCFLVDPLDGTKEFIRGNGMYTVNIALMERRDNSRWSPILGVVFAPEFGITWFGGRRMGAMRQDAGGIGEISAGTNNSAPLIVGSVSHASPRDRAFAEAVGEHVFEGVGSSMKICRVAEGSADMAPRFGTRSDIFRALRASVGKISAKCCSFSAVLAPIFARKYAFCSIFQNLPDSQAEIFEI